MLGNGALRPHVRLVRGLVSRLKELACLELRSLMGCLTEHAAEVC